MTATAQLEYFRAKARRLEDERDQLRVDLAYERSNTLMLRAENVELREMVRELHHELDAATQYEAGGSRGIVSEFADAMRKRGIEVDA